MHSLFRCFRRHCRLSAWMYVKMKCVNLVAAEAETASMRFFSFFFECTLRTIVLSVVCASFLILSIRMKIKVLKRFSSKPSRPTLRQHNFILFVFRFYHIIKCSSASSNHFQWIHRTKVSQSNATIHFVGHSDLYNVMENGTVVCPPLPHHIVCHTIFHLKHLFQLQIVMECRA